jgi:hypothetical protein
MRKNVKTQFRMFSRHGIFYCEDVQTGKQESLKTRDRREAARLLHARNEQAARIKDDRIQKLETTLAELQNNYRMVAEVLKLNPSIGEVEAVLERKRRRDGHNDGVNGRSTTS